MSDSVSAEKIQQVKKTKFLMKSVKFVDIFLDGYGIYTSNLVLFEMKFLEANHFPTTKELFIYQ